MIKLLIGGSPCTFWSIAQKNGRETEAEGLGWELFKNYLVAKEKFKPDFFLYENNKSAAQPIKDQISTELGVDLMYINSALVSAQNRQRFYAFNWEVEQPKDRGILLRDILESSVVDGEKAYPLLVSHQGNARDYFKKQHVQIVCEPVRVGDIGSTAQAHRVYSCDGKSVTINAGGGGQGGKTGLYTCPVKTLSDGEIAYMFRKEGRMEYGYIQNADNDKAKCITANIHKGVPYNVMIQKADGNLRPIYNVENGVITVNDSKYPIKLKDGQYIIRKLTPVECERLQTLPDGYTKAVSNAQRYKGLGNGWTAEVIIHILNGALKDVPRDEEIVVLSMYDGIGTGRYCLDKMGFTNVKYFAYEIDKYAKQVATSNYPDIIHMGDAFNLRHPDWTIGY